MGGGGTPIYNIFSLTVPIFVLLIFNALFLTFHLQETERVKTSKSVANNLKRQQNFENVDIVCVYFH